MQEYLARERKASGAMAGGPSKKKNGVPAPAGGGGDREHATGHAMLLQNPDRTSMGLITNRQKV